MTKSTNNQMQAIVLDTAKFAKKETFAEIMAKAIDAALVRVAHENDSDIAVVRAIYDLYPDNFDEVFDKPTDEQYRLVQERARAIHNRRGGAVNYFMYWGQFLGFAI